MTPLFRTWKFAVLGMSLSSVFDVKGVDTLKALTTILNEYDQMPDQPPEETGRPKVHHRPCCVSINLRCLANDSVRYCVVNKLSAQA